MHQSKLEKIEKLYHQYDFMKLINSYWGNYEEYENEALKLSLRLHAYDTISSIQQKVWDIFYSSFCIKYYYRFGKRNLVIMSKKEAIKQIGDLDKYLEFAIKIKEILDE